jgi:uncharacterized membrane protein YvlD (DUF360 family)
MASVPPLPPALPIPRSPSVWRPVRLLAVGVAQALALLVVGAIADGVTVAGAGPALFAVVVIAVVGAVVWPVVIRLTLPLITATVGLFTFVLDAAAIALAAALVDGFEVSSWWWALLVALVVAAVGVAVGGAVHADDDRVWRQHVVGRLARRRGEVERSELPGIVFVQVDGLGADVLRDAMASGHAPTLASLVEHGTHVLHDWECDLSSQTGAMQAGILLGDNSNMPAFRWYEKETGRVMVSNRPGDAADIEARQSTGTGLLVDGGASRANVFSGDAPDAMFTFSRLRERSGKAGIVYVVATPFAILRILALGVADIVRELRSARRARTAGVVPRMHRGGSYPLLRAATTVGLAEVTQAVLVADVLRGVPATYVDLVGYDEVAHHSGVAAPEALDTLRRTDELLRRVFAALDRAPRPYHVVVLSDHGQTQGSTFRQRYGLTLDELVSSLIAGAEVEAPRLAEEGWTNVNGLLTDAANDDSVLGRTVDRATRRRQVDGEVALGPTTELSSTDSDVVVLASGNLGLLSFPRLPGRATRQQLDATHPGLLEGLATHAGIGFLMVRDEVEGDVVLGAAGSRRLADDRIEGVDPLAPFGSRAADHLRRTGGFTNCPDVVVNSFYDPDSGEGAAFEELIGFHGGLGGPQGAPFVLAPSALSAPTDPLVGARSIHDLFAGWLVEVGIRPAG